MPSVKERARICRAGFVLRSCYILNATLAAATILEQLALPLDHVPAGSALHKFGSANEFLRALHNELVERTPVATTLVQVGCGTPSLVEALGGEAAVSVLRCDAEVAALQFEDSSGLFDSVSDASILLVVRGTGNRQDRCAVEADLHAIWPKISAGGAIVLHGGNVAETEFVCRNGSVIAGGIRASAEDFARGRRGVLGLDTVGLTPGQSLPTGLGMWSPPGAEAPLWVLQKTMSAACQISHALPQSPVFASPAALAAAVSDAAEDADALDARVRNLLQEQHFDHTDEYMAWLSEKLPTLSETELRTRVDRALAKLRAGEPMQRVPRLLHQVYGFKCTNWQTGRWEEACVDQAKFNMSHEDLEECLGGALPWSKAESDAEVEISVSVMGQLVQVCCGAEPPKRAPLSVWRGDDKPLQLAVECIHMPRHCCAAGEELLAHQRSSAPGALREDYQRWSASWRRLHTKWKYMLWGPMEVKQLIHEHYSWLEAVIDGYPNWIYRADAAQWIVLHHFGGVLATMDLEALRPIDDLLGGAAVPGEGEQGAWAPGSVGVYDWSVTALLNEDGVITGNGQMRRLDMHLVAFVPRHPLMREMLNGFFEHRHEFVLLATGNERLTATVYGQGYRNQIGLRVLPHEVYNPIRWSDSELRRRCYLEVCSDIFPESRGVHHHSNSWFGVKNSAFSSANFTGAAVQPAGSQNAECWNGDFTAKLCCDTQRFGPTGMKACWSEGFSFQRCCSEHAALT